jgi:hypothetical protein
VVANDLAAAVAAEDADAIAAKRANAASRAGNSAGIQEVRKVAGPRRARLPASVSPANMKNETMRG